MKSLVLASVLSSAAVAYTVPVLAGPIHFQTTKPYSMFGQFVFNGQPTSHTLGIAPLDFVITDVLLGNSSSTNVPASSFLVTANGAPVFNCALDVQVTGAFYSRSTHLTNGFLVPAGSTVGVQGTGNGQSAVPVTLVGYLQ